MNCFRKEFVVPLETMHFRVPTYHAGNEKETFQQHGQQAELNKT